MDGERRSDASCEAGDLCGLNVTGKADLISLDLSDMFVVECPWYDDDERGHLALGSSTPINPVRARLSTCRLCRILVASAACPLASCSLPQSGAIL